MRLVFNCSWTTAYLEYGLFLFVNIMEYNISIQEATTRAQAETAATKTAGTKKAGTKTAGAKTAGGKRVAEATRRAASWR